MKMFVNQINLLVFEFLKKENTGFSSDINWIPDGMSFHFHLLAIFDAAYFFTVVIHDL